MRVALLSIAFMRKYFGNKTSWQRPKVWRGSEKYRASPETKVIHIWAPKCVAKDPKYTKVVKGFTTLSLWPSLCSSGHTEKLITRTSIIEAKWAGWVVLVRILQVKKKIPSISGEMTRARRPTCRCDVKTRVNRETETHLKATDLCTCESPPRSSSKELFVHWVDRARKSATKTFSLTNEASSTGRASKKSSWFLALFTAKHISRVVDTLHTIYIRVQNKTDWATRGLSVI